MAWMRSLKERLNALFRKGQMDAELDEELRFHIEREIEKNIRAGMDPKKARRTAYVRFGGVERVKDQSRDERGVRPLEDLWSDIRYALRTLWKSPAFTLIALFSLSLGIGANTAIFTAVNAILIRDKPFTEPDELLNIYRDRVDGQFDPLNYPDYLELIDGTPDVFTDIAGFQFAFAQRETDEGLQTLVGEMVTGNYFPLLGVSTRVGRTLLPEDHVSPGGHPVVVLGHDFWLREFGGDTGAIGQSLRLSGNNYTIVGVAPPEYAGFWRGLSPDFFAPIMMISQILPIGGNALESRGWNSFNAFGRLQPGVSEAQVGVSLRRVSDHLKESFPDVWQGGDSLVSTATSDVLINPAADGMVAGANVLAMVVVGLVLLIACANLASFLLARSTDRRKEIAVRLAMGATRERLGRQFITETLVLAFLGGALGLLVAAWVLRLALGMTLPFPVPIGLDLSFDWVVLGFTLAVSVATGILVGLVPALQATKPDLAPTLKDESTGGGKPRALALGNFLVAGQMALSLVLLVGAGLFIRSFGASQLLDPGFGYDPAGFVSFVTPADRYSVEERYAYVNAFVDEARTLPGVTDVGIVCNIHLNLVNTMFLDINVDGVSPPPGRSAHYVDFTSVDPGFFAVAGIRLLEGRNFDEGDRSDGAPVTIVNEAFVERFWPGESALGRTIDVAIEGWVDPMIVGVVSTAKIRGLGEAPRPFMYLPYAQETNAWTSVIARTRGDAQATARDLYRLLRESYPEAIISENKTMAEHIGIMLIARRLSAVLATVFAIVALTLATIGLYGVVSYAVSRRAREMGIRMSLGAEPTSVVRLMVKGGMRLVVFGGVFGLLAALATSRVLSGFLYGVSTFDPVTLTVVPTTLLGVAFLAAYIPARRASRVDPVRSLKAE